jgi:type IV pilus assembly protein PilE
MLNKPHGVSFIELLITLSIIGILASIAYPSYLNYLTKARRHDGQIALLALANQMEQYYSTHHTYQTATIGSGGPTDIQTNTHSPEGFYALTIIEQSDTSYTLQATALGLQAKNDSMCHFLTFNQLGIKNRPESTPNTPPQTNNPCW